MVKFQTKLIKAVSKENKCRYFVDGYEVLITFDGQRAVRIPKNDFYLDLEKFGEMPRLQSIMSLCDTVTPVYILPIVENENKLMLRHFKDEKGKLYFLNEAFVKDMIFSPSEYTFYYRGDMILCCINDIVIEAICVRKKKD